MMEIMPNTCFKNLKRYWRRRKYQKLSGKRRKIKVLRLGGGSTASGRQSWKIRKISKLRLRIISPLRLLARFHDAYVDMMIRLASGLGKANSGSLFGGKKIVKDPLVAVVSGGVEVDSKLILQTYKRLAASRELRTD